MGAVVQHSLLSLLRLRVLAERRVDDHELVGDPSRLRDEAVAVGSLEMAVEAHRRDALERAVGKRQVERVTPHERGFREATGCDLEHPLALVEAGDLSGRHRVA